MLLRTYLGVLMTLPQASASRPPPARSPGHGWHAPQQFATARSARNRNPNSSLPRLKGSEAASQRYASHQGGTTKLPCILGNITWSAVLCLGDCLQPDSGDSSASIEQASFGGNLGSVVGNPVASNNTTGLSNDDTPTCAPSSAPDLAYVWTAPSTGTYTFSTVATLVTTFDTVLQIRDFTTGAPLGCNDDSSGTLQSTVSVNLSIGQAIKIVVDGFGSNSGPFRLSIAGAGGAVGRNYLCGYALPGFGCNNGRASTGVVVADMTAAVSACHIAQPPNLPDFCYVLDRDGTAATDASQCAAAGGSWRPGNSCCNFLGSVSCP